jgi:hypothetical protein
MQRKEPHANKEVCWHGCLLAKNFLTRRANQGHISIVAQFARPPMALPIGARGARPKIPTIEIAPVTVH